MSGRHTNPEELGPIDILIAGSDRRIVITPNMRFMLALWEHVDTPLKERVTTMAHFAGEKEPADIYTKKMSDEELIAELKRVLERLKPQTTMLVGEGTTLLDAMYLPQVDQAFNSTISGEAGCIRYYTSEVDIYLTKEEAVRLMATALRPHEALALIKEVGMFYEVHDDFYDPKTGHAFQPKIPVEANSALRLN